jgi:hypothetical protein
MSTVIVRHQLFKINLGTVSNEERDLIQAAIDSIRIGGGEPQSDRAIIPLGRDYSLMVTPELRLIFRPEGDELHILGVLNEAAVRSFIHAQDQAARSQSGQGTRPVTAT